MKQRWFQKSLGICLTWEGKQGTEREPNNLKISWLRKKLTLNESVNHSSWLTGLVPSLVATVLIYKMRSGLLLRTKRATQGQSDQSLPPSTTPPMTHTAS